jgi:hypothetical protein
MSKDIVQVGPLFRGRTNSNNTAISGSVLTYGNNRIFANIGDGTPLTPVGSVSSENGLK